MTQQSDETAKTAHAASPADPSESAADALVALMYELAVNPLAFDGLLAKWEAAIAGRGVALDEAPPLSDAFVDHARRAEQILTRLERAEPAERVRSISAAVAGEPYPAVVVSGSGLVLDANAAFGALFGARSPEAVQDVLAEAAEGGAWARLTARLASAGPGGEGRVLGLLDVALPGTGERLLFLLQRARCPEDPRVGALLCALFPAWDDRISAPVQRHFGLTAAELDIVKALVSGAGLGAIADARGRSIHTVRTQVKSLLAKTGFASQVDLVRHVAAFRPAPAIAPSPTGGPAHDRPEIERLAIPGGRGLDYALIGPEGGDPVLFVHGMIDSLTMSGACRELLDRRNLRLIAPARPHFGGSDGYASGEVPTEAFADLAVRLLDALGMDRAPVIGHMAGALYAYHLAQRHPQRVSHIVSVAGAIPMREPWQFERMSTGHRIAGLTARRAPAMLPVLVRGGIQLLRQTREADMMELMFRDAPVDAALASAPEVHALMMDRFLFVTKQGHRAFEIDVRQVSADWSAFAGAISHPVGLVHGRHDRVVLIEGVEAFARRANMPLCVAEDAGQLVWTRRPELAFDMLDRLAAAHAGETPA